jgi:hypothetical protein
MLISGENLQTGRQLVEEKKLEVKVAGVTALHRAFNIKGLGLQPHLSGPIDAKGFSGALTNLGGDRERSSSTGRSLR